MNRLSQILKTAILLTSSLLLLSLSTSCSLLVDDPTKGADDGSDSTDTLHSGGTEATVPSDTGSATSPDSSDTGHGTGGDTGNTGISTGGDSGTGGDTVTGGDTGTSTGTGGDTGSGDTSTGIGDTGAGPIACDANSARDLCGAGALCVDGYCCNQACDHVCESCALPGYEGTCMPFPKGDDPDSEAPPCQVCNGGNGFMVLPDGPDLAGDCPPETGCGNTGNCFAGACELAPFGTECQTPVCGGEDPANPVFTSYTCDGGGGCNPSIGNCGGYRCQDAANCYQPGSCGTTSPCAAGLTCDAGLCVGKKADGERCSVDDECIRGNCADSYCCNTPCEGACETCAATPGTCALFDDRDGIATNDSPPGACSPCEGCTGARADCVVVPGGQDWQGDCPSDGNACNGAESCSGAGYCHSNSVDPCLYGGRCNDQCNQLDSSNNYNCYVGEGTLCGADETACSWADICNGVGGCAPNDKDRGIDCGTCQACNGNGACVGNSLDHDDCGGCEKCVSGGCQNQTADEDLKDKCDPIDCSAYIWGSDGSGCLAFAGPTPQNGNCNGAGACTDVYQACSGAGSRLYSCEEVCSYGCLTGASTSDAGCRTSYDFGYCDHGFSCCPSGWCCNEG